MSRFSLLLALCFFGACAGVIFAQNPPGPGEAYLAELLERSDSLHLAQWRQWLLLLHYRTTLSGGFVSEVNDPQFFLAPEGKTDPQAELAATLRALFSGIVLGEDAQPVQCAFIARYQWLKEMLAFDEQRLPSQFCGHFEEWWQALNPASVSLIFPSAYMNNPASLFGHTLLRIDQRGQTEQTRLLAYVVNFAAHVTSHNRLAYVVSGIGGGFRGDFSIKPYYELVKAYGDFENRDIWEYRLRLSYKQLRRMLMHLWELKPYYFDYFFFKENCAYQIIALLEVALPELHFTDDFRLWTVPADTVRLLAAYPGLIEKAVYRPAPSTQIRSTFAHLSPEERRSLKAIVENDLREETLLFAKMPAERAGVVLDLAAEYLQYKLTEEKIANETKKAHLYHLLVARSTLALSSPSLSIEPFVTQPDLGHGSVRTGVGFGQRNGEWFEELLVRAGYHDLLDADLGYTPGSQVEVAGLRLRRYEKRNQVRLDQFVLGDLVSLSPWSMLLPAPSWKLRAALETRHWRQCRYCYSLNLNGGVGAAVETRLLHKEIFFIFPEIEMDVSHAFAQSYRIGGGCTVGIVATLTDRWKLMSSGTYLHFPFGSVTDDVRAMIGQSYALSRNWALRSEFHHRRYEDEFILQLQTFF